MTEPKYDTVNFTLERALGLKTAYDRAVRTKQESFMFDGHAYFTRYASYLIEYLSNTFTELK